MKLMELKSGGETLLMNPDKIHSIYISSNGLTTIDTGFRVISVEGTLNQAKNMFEFCINDKN